MSDVLIKNVDIFNNAMAKAEFKDKFGRAIQYGARMVAGFLTDADSISPSKDRRELIAKVWSVLVFVSIGHPFR